MEVSASANKTLKTSASVVSQFLLKIVSLFHENIQRDITLILWSNVVLFNTAT